METLLKHWPANMWIQTPLELTDLIMTKYHLGKDDVADVTVDPPVLARMEYYPEGYTSLTQAQFSIPFMLASYICDPTPSCKWLARERLTDPEILTMAAKVHGGPSEPLFMPKCFKDFQKGKDGHHPIMTVTIKTNDGREYSETMKVRKAFPEAMASCVPKVPATGSMSTGRTGSRLPCAGRDRGEAASMNQSPGIRLTARLPQNLTRLKPVMVPNP